MIRSIVKVSLIFPLLLVRAQTISVPFTQSAVTSQFPDTIVIILKKPFIDERTIAVTVDSVPVTQIHFDRTTNSVRFIKQSDWDNDDSITISYEYQQLNLQPVYRLHTLSFTRDSAGPTQTVPLFSRSDGLFGNTFGPELSKSGSITRGFFVGSNSDLTLSSGFRLQLSGKLSDNIDVVAALTDENTPIQPQGNTQTLQEVDNVFVQINSPVYSATLGDFVFDATGGEFARLHRKVQGARVNADHSENIIGTTMQVIGASSRGKFHSVQFNGIDGVQGPYRLTGKNNERAIVVIAGSERVYVDGERMIRGDQNDYSIEYGSAEITFSTKRMITFSSRITVDFEYSDRQFTRNLFGVSADTKLSSSATMFIKYFQEGDDPDAPIDIALTEEDRAILRSAGNTLPVRSGAVIVGIDSTGIGKGNYAASDTVINGTTIRIYRFEQFTPAAVYSVVFSAAPDGRGDYRREAPGRYRFVGIGAGEFLPIILIPAPQQQQLFSFRTVVSPLREFTLEGEFAASNSDPNRLSEVNDNTNNGAAYNVTARFAPENIIIDGISLGSADVQLSQRFKDGRFRTFDRTEEVEFGRKWSTDSLMPSSAVNEHLREGRIRYSPQSSLTFSSGIGTMERTGQFYSRRIDGSVEWVPSNYPRVQYYIERIDGEESLQKLNNSWIRQRGEIRHALGRWTPSLRYTNEERRVFFANSDSLTGSSYFFRSGTPNITVRQFFGMDVRGELEYRENYAGILGRMEKQSRSLMLTSAVEIPEVQHYTGSFSFSRREHTFEQLFQQTNTNNVTTLVKASSRYRPFSNGVDVDLFYDVSTQRTASLERYFYKVRKGEGQFIWSDFNADGIVDLFDEREFRPDRFEGEYIALTRSSELLIPIVHVKTTSRVRIVPRRFISTPTTTLEKAISMFSTESFLRIEERSTESRTEKIYLLDPSVLLNPRTTQAGSQFQQHDLFLFENDPDRSFRFRFSQRRSIGQFTGGLEQNYSRERAVRARLQLTSDITDQTEIVLQNDNAVSASAINRSREISTELLRTDLSYRPETNSEFGFLVETSQSEDRNPIRPVIANVNGQTVRYVRGFAGTGQARFEISREEVILGDHPAGYSAPYELTAGKDLGKNFLWTFSSEYRARGNVQFSLSYSGRTTQNAGIIHSGRMEVRAYF